MNSFLTAERADPPRKGQRDLRQADTSAWEGEIDQLVYQLYGLTEDDVKIVEGKGYDRQ